MTVGIDTVTWSRFEQPFRLDRDYAAFGPFRFGRRHYVSAVDRVAALVSIQQL
jgi:hypothetical protein